MHDVYDMCGMYNMHDMYDMHGIYDMFHMHDIYRAVQHDPPRYYRSNQMEYRTDPTDFEISDLRSQI